MTTISNNKVIEHTVYQFNSPGILEEEEKFVNHEP